MDAPRRNDDTEPGPDKFRSKYDSFGKHVRNRREYVQRCENARNLLSRWFTNQGVSVDQALQSKISHLRQRRVTYSLSITLSCLTEIAVVRSRVRAARIRESTCFWGRNTPLAIAARVQAVAAVPNKTADVNPYPAQIAAMPS